MAGPPLSEKGLSRRDFLTLAALIPAGALLAACGPQQEDPAQELQPPDPTQVPSKPQPQDGTSPTQTNSPTPKETALNYINDISNNIEAGSWASDEETGSFMPEKMFPLVGAVNKLHHFAVDLSYRKLRIAALTNEDVTQKDAESYAEFKKTQTELLSGNDVLKYQLDTVIQQIDAAKLDTYTAIVEENSLKRVVLLDGQKTKYFVLENESLRQLSIEEIPPLRSPLEIRDGKLWSEGEEIRLTGAVMPHFQLGEQQWFTYS